MYHMYQAIVRKVDYLGLKRYYCLKNKQFDIILRELMIKTMTLARIPAAGVIIIDAINTLSAAYLGHEHKSSPVVSTQIDCFK